MRVEVAEYAGQPHSARREQLTSEHNSVVYAVDTCLYRQVQNLNNQPFIHSFIHSRSSTRTTRAHCQACTSHKFSGFNLLTSASDAARRTYSVTRSWWPEPASCSAHSLSAAQQHELQPARSRLTTDQRDVAVAGRYCLMSLGVSRSSWMETCSSTS